MMRCKGNGDVELKEIDDGGGELKEIKCGVGDR
jgi:hypothetical protein